MVRDNEGDPTPSFGEAARVWLRIGLISFGGPAGQIALMHRVLVDERKWLDERTFLSALNFCMLLPGPEAMQLATYAGWRLHGLAGGLVAGLFFVLPGAAVVLVLSMLYAVFGSHPIGEALFTGVKAAVLVIVVEALLRIAKRALKEQAHWVIAASAFVAIFFLHVPYPLIILAAAAYGFVMLQVAVPPRSPPAAAANVLATPASPAGGGVMVWTAAATALVWLAIWWLPLAALMLALGTDHVLSQAGLFFSKLAIVTFGGAYAVLAYMAQAVVEQYRWLSAGEMLDGLGLAETTPGPLILVTEFVGFVAAYRQGGDSLAMGMAGAAVALWATFVPCFMWIFTGAPFIERLNDMPRLKAALAAVTAAVVGVILNLSVWFGLRVLFGTFTPFSLGPVAVDVPVLSTLDPIAAGLAALAGLMLLVWHKGIILTLAVSAGLALALHVLFGGSGV
ncbi:MAG: chromate efflux transporter [Hyphomicrobiaceae bacterium]|nr:chromate efflux transporter [Hyphomicrobiaceae bacterium]